MLNHSFGLKRVVLSAGVLACGIIARHSFTVVERVPRCQPLSNFPATLGGWTSSNLPLEPRIVKAAGVDEYVNRVYIDAHHAPVQLYIGYYKSQRTGDTIHSPKNCLPGGGWQPVVVRRIALRPFSGKPLPINEYVVERGLDKDLILYWYQARGRVIASEYWAKIWMIVDALRLHRTDGALVRVLTSASDGEAEARGRALRFAETVYPRLNQFVPND